MSLIDSDGLLPDAIVDLGLITFDIASYAYNKVRGCDTSGDVASLKANTLGLLIPGATGLGLGIRTVKGFEKFSDPKFAQQLQRQFAKDGYKSVQKSLKSLEKRLIEHQEKLSNLKYKSSVEREIRGFEKQIDTAKQFLKEKGIE